MGLTLTICRRRPIYINNIPFDFRDNSDVTYFFKYGERNIIVPFNILLNSSEVFQLERDITVRIFKKSNNVRVKITAPKYIPIDRDVVHIRKLKERSLNAKSKENGVSKPGITTGD